MNWGLDFLLANQAADGSWGYRLGAPGAVEPTAWALVAVVGASAAADAPTTHHGQSAIRWLLATQLPDGAWPAFRGQREGCWVASLAVRALYLAGAGMPSDLECGPAPAGPLSGSEASFRPTRASEVARFERQSVDRRTALQRGLNWLLDDWPAEGSLGWRLRRALAAWASGGATSPVRQDHSLRGWSWTPGTASWVEPTAQMLITLRELFPGTRDRGWGTVDARQAPWAEERGARRWRSLARRAARRQRLAELMLYDRMCPGGGWNSGNPLVYGVAGVPRIGPTAWALVALHPPAQAQPASVPPHVPLADARGSVADARGSVADARGSVADARGSEPLIPSRDREGAGVGVPAPPRAAPGPLAGVSAPPLAALRTSLDWLERTYDSISGPASLALAHLCLAQCGRAVPPLAPALTRFPQSDDTLTHAWAALAMEEDRLKRQKAESK